MNEYIVTVDLAKKRDFVALFVMKRTPVIVQGSKSLRSPTRVVNFLDVVHIDKFQNIPYPQVSRIICTRMGHTSLSNNADLLVDGTGVGAAVVDQMREDGLTPLSIITTGGGKVTEVHDQFGSTFGSPGDSRLHPVMSVKEYHVPKPDLIAAGQRILQQERVRVAPGVPWEAEFKAQMIGFKGQLNEGARILKAEAEFERVHDDLVSCLLMGAWWFTREDVEEIPERPLPISSKISRKGGYDPYDYM